MFASTSKPSCAPVDDSSARLARQRRYFLWRVQKMAFWVLYDNAGSLILLNLTTLLLVLGPAWLLLQLPGGTYPQSAGVAALVALMVVAGQANVIKSLLEEEEFSLRRVAQGIAAHGFAVVGYGVLFALAETVACLGAGFYATQVAPARPALGWCLSGFCLSAGLAVLLSGVYVLPARIYQSRAKRRVMRASAALAGAHPMATLGLVVLMAGYGIFLATPPGLLLFSTIPLVTLVCCAYELLARHYAEVPVFDENDHYLNRGFNDFLFPWKG